MAEIDSLKNKNDDVVLPRTVTEAVFDSTSGQMLNIVLEGLRGNQEIEDYSTSGTGYYIKFKNGLIIQTMSTSHDVVINEAWGGLFISERLFMNDWIVPMVETPFTFLTMRSEHSIIQSSLNRVSSTSGGSIYVTRPTASENPITVRFHQLAFGRWK